MHTVVTFSLRLLQQPEFLHLETNYWKRGPSLVVMQQFNYEGVPRSAGHPVIASQEALCSMNLTAKSGCSYDNSK